PPPPGSPPAAVSPADDDRRRDVLSAVMGGLYTTVDLAEEPATAAWPPPSPVSLGGLALGIPDPTGIEDGEGSAPIDRVISSLTGTTWSALVLAYPVDHHRVSAIRDQVLNELRAVETETKDRGAPSPLAEHYGELLKVTLTSLNDGMATGAWRTAVYLIGDEQSYPRLAAAWRSQFSGARSLPEPVRIHDLPAAVALARDWVMPDQEVESRPGKPYRRPFEFQTLLTTTQLAAYAHLPELETPGFRVETVPRFDTAPSAVSDDGVPIGRIVARKRETTSEYRVNLRALTRHVFVAGVTGSGKTNTILSLLSAADSADVPFLVIEPAKAEYRSLLSHPVLAPRLRVFTAGRADLAPLPLNPFEVPDGIPVSEHLDLIRSAFSVAFGMWTPLPQILERCLYEIYADRGWDLRWNTNIRLRPGDDPALAYPTLADLVAKVQEVIPTLGYEDRIAGDLRAALVTRLESLRTGGKGAMLDVSRSMPSEQLFGQPTIVELESLGDDGDKAFVAALLLIRLAEHRRVAGHRPDLVHLLVIEEAHRLLSDTGISGPRPEESADPRGQAVETFSNLLAEIRVYGQGVVIADQVPVRLAPGVIKNTDLKIAHRLVAADDRAAMAGSMVMDEEQARALAVMAVGEAAVFSTGDDSPVLVRIPLVKDALAETPFTHGDVLRHMARRRSDPSLATLNLARPFCAQTCAGDEGACTAARRLAADEYVQRTISRIVLSTVDEDYALDRLWPELQSVVSARRPPRTDLGRLLRSLAGHGADWYAQRRGAQGAWLYADTSELGDRLRAVLLDKLDGHDPTTTTRLRAALRDTTHRLHARIFAPYSGCERICTQDPPVCLYRYAVADVVAGHREHQAWREADDIDGEDPDRRRIKTWRVCQDAAFGIIEPPEADLPPELHDRINMNAGRVALCFEQQMLHDDRNKSPRNIQRILNRVLGEAYGAYEATGSATTGI
ncbi:ATP-binding protein, partial [Acrocarpospora catenulata]|uniref:ATP-binding protein n=1 Tax=Acrocarpospora catenulata TaxID=2836182 RepID=UPI001BD9D49C